MTVFPNHRWRSPDGLVHHVACHQNEQPTIEWKDRMFKARGARHEANTPCGVRIGDSHFVYAIDAPTCFWCVVDVFAGWRGAAL